MNAPALSTWILALAGVAMMGCSGNAGEPTGDPSGQTSSAVSGPLPFKGSASAQDTNTADGADEAGSGEATLLGKFNYSASFVFNPDGSADGTSVWTAADGDTFSTNVHVVVTGGSGSILDLADTHTVTGGTGRLQGASGTFVVNCVLNLDTNHVDETFNGSLTP